MMILYIDGNSVEINADSTGKDLSNLLNLINQKKVLKFGGKQITKEPLADQGICSEATLITAPAVMIECLDRDSKVIENIYYDRSSLLDKDIFESLKTFAPEGTFTYRSDIFESRNCPMCGHRGKKHWQDSLCEKCECKRY